MRTTTTPPSDVLEIIFDSFKMLLNSTPEEMRLLVGLLMVIASLTILAILAYVILIRPAHRLFSAYMLERNAHARHRIENVSALCWGNSLLRAPLIAIGTDIYAFALTSTKGKAIRYIKSASAFVPVLWCIFSLVILIAGIMESDPNWYIMGAPIALIAISIYVLDVSIIAAQGSRRAKIARMLIAVITGYLFSSIPLNLVFKSDINSYLFENDEQLNRAVKNIDKQIEKIKIEGWYSQLQGQQETLPKLATQREDERNGKGVTGLKNKPWKNNPVYEQISDEYEKIDGSINRLSSQHAGELQLLEQLYNEKVTKRTSIQQNNSTNHIKRHSALWSYAFSSIASALYFACMLLLFWCVDSLAVLVSFLEEDEYWSHVHEQNELRKIEFSKDSFRDKFKPIIADNSTS